MAKTFPKNYYLFTIKNKKGEIIIKRETINLNDIYPESYALNRIRNKYGNADIFAKILNGKGIWQKHNLYPENMEFGDEKHIQWKKLHKEYMIKHWNMLFDEGEKFLLFRDWEKGE